MDARLILATFVTLVLPAVMAFWITIHGCLRFWRKAGVVPAYSAAAIAMTIAAWFAWYWRQQLLGSDLGFSWLTVIPGVLIYAVSIWLSKSVRAHLSLSTFAGVPEIKNNSQCLISEGPYTVVRHPRYTLVIVGIIGWCLVCNFLGTYVVGVIAICGFYLIAVLEERELQQRFGQAYFDYQTKVPQIIPTFAGLVSFFRLRKA